MTDMPSFDGRSGEQPSPSRRKIQMTGGATFTVSLPKPWAEQQELEPGMGVEIYPRGNWLAIALADAAGRRRAVTLSARDRTPSEITRSIRAAYVSGCEEIRIESIGDRENRKAIGQAVMGLVGIEIQEETESAIVARTMLDISDLSPIQTIKQIELNTLDMHDRAIEAVLTVDEETARSVMAQDDSVDRLFGLICRIFQRSLVDVSIPQQENGLTTFEYYTAARQLERIADHAEKIAGVTSQLSAPPTQGDLEDLRRLADQSRDLVQRAVGALFDDQDPTRLGKIVADADRFVDEAETFDRTLYEDPTPDNYALGTVIDSLSRTSEYAANIAEAGLQASFREPPSSL